jgi:3-phosphoshikimate 1-carboxyvinyltransferase
MAAAIASLRCKEPVILEDPMAVRKSYPGFYQDLERILITLPR